MSRQIEFPEKQTHEKSFEYGMLLFSVLCILFVIVMVNVVGGGGV